MTTLNIRNAVIARDDSFLCAEVDGELLLMHIENGSYYSASPTGNRIWTLLASPCRFEWLCDQLEQRYNAPRETIESEVHDFLEHLIKEGMAVLR